MKLYNIPSAVNAIWFLLRASSSVFASTSAESKPVSQKYGWNSPSPTTLGTGRMISLNPAREVVRKVMSPSNLDCGTARQK